MENLTNTISSVYSKVKTKAEECLEFVGNKGKNVLTEAALVVALNSQPIDATPVENNNNNLDNNLPITEVVVDYPETDLESKLNEEFSAKSKNQETLQENSTTQTEKIISVSDRSKLSQTHKTLINEINARLKNNKSTDMDSLLCIPNGVTPYGVEWTKKFSKEASFFAGANVPIWEKNMKLKLDLKDKYVYINMLEEPDYAIFNPETMTLNTTKIQQVLTGGDAKALEALFTSIQTIKEGNYPLSNLDETQLTNLSASFGDKILTNGIPDGLQKSAYIAYGNLLSLKKEAMDQEKMSKYVKVIDNAFDYYLENIEFDVDFPSIMTSYLFNNEITTKYVSQSESKKLIEKSRKLSDKIPLLESWASRFFNGSLYSPITVGYITPFSYANMVEKAIDGVSKPMKELQSSSILVSNLIGVASYAAIDDEATPIKNIIDEVNSKPLIVKAVMLTALLANSSEYKNQKCFTEIKKVFQQNPSMEPLVKLLCKLIGQKKTEAFGNDMYKDIYGKDLSVSSSDIQFTQNLLANQDSPDVFDGAIAVALSANNSYSLAGNIIKSFKATDNPQVAQIIIKDAFYNKEKISSYGFTVNDLITLTDKIKDATQRALLITYSLALFGNDYAAKIGDKEMNTAIGMSISEFQEITTASSHRKNEPATHFRDLVTILTLHNMSPDKNIAYELFKTHNITRFSRYNINFLMDQYNKGNKPNGKPPYLVINPKMDPNGAFNSYYGEQLTNGFDVQMMELGNQADAFFSKLDTLIANYISQGGSLENCRILVQGHGGKNMIIFAKTAQEELIDGNLTTNEPNFWREFSKRFAGCDLVFGSCSVGGELAYTTAKYSGCRVYAATTEVGGGNDIYDSDYRIVHSVRGQINKPSTKILDGRIDAKLTDTTLALEPNKSIEMDIIGDNKDIKSFAIKSGESNGYTVGQVSANEVLIRKKGESKDVITIKINNNKIVIDPKNLTEDFEIDVSYTIIGKDRYAKTVSYEQIETTDKDAFTPELDGKLTIKYEKVDKPIEISELNLNAHSLTLGTTETYQLNVNITPSNATNQEVIRESSDPSVATVDQTGLVKASSLGNAEISVKTPDGKLADTCKISVPTSIRETIRTAKINIFPNPAQNELSISILEKLNDYTGKVEIFDEAGNVLQSEEISGPTAGFDVSALPVGIYFIKGKIGGKQITERFVKK